LSGVYGWFRRNPGRVHGLIDACVRLETQISLFENERTAKNAAHAYYSLLLHTMWRVEGVCQELNVFARDEALILPVHSWHVLLDA
jgi:hypothetical protein